MTEVAHDIEIEHLIVHKVDHEKYDQPRFSDRETPTDAEVKRFLLGHISDNREHQNTRTAKFDSSPNGERSVQQVVEAILTDPSDFIDHTKTIAERMYESLDGRTSPCDLVICTFLEGTSQDRWVTILKMDPEDGFVAERVQDDDGAYYIKLSRVDDVLPTELQKCAFILPEEQREVRDYHLKVLDQQIGSSQRRRPVASFFTEEFLRCNIDLHAADRTYRFYDGGETFLDEKREEWDPADQDRFEERLRATVKDEIINVHNFAEAVIPDEEEREEYFETLEDTGLEDRVFEANQDVGRSVTQYKKFEGDDGLRIRIPSDYKETEKFNVEKQGDTHVITIQTVRWEPA